MQQTTDAPDTVLFHIGDPFAHAEQRIRWSLGAKHYGFMLSCWSEAKFSHAFFLNRASPL